MEDYQLFDCWDKLKIEKASSHIRVDCRFCCVSNSGAT